MYDAGNRLRECPAGNARSQCEEKRERPTSTHEHLSSAPTAASNQVPPLHGDRARGSCPNPMPESFHAVSSGADSAPIELRLVDPVGEKYGVQENPGRGAAEVAVTRMGHDRFVRREAASHSGMSLRVRAYRPLVVEALREVNRIADAHSAPRDLVGPDLEVGQRGAAVDRRERAVHGVLAA